MRSCSRPLIVIALSLAVSGCGEGRTRPAPVVSVRDSAGLRTVEIPPLDGLELPEWIPQKLHSTNGVVDLFRVAGALFLDDGTLVIANTGSAELVFMDPNGSLTRRVGRKGEGPGEFTALQAVLPDAEGGVLAFDGRLSSFAANGTFKETRRLDAPNRVVSLLPLAALPGGRMLAVLSEQRTFRLDGERRDTVPLMVIGPEGVDTLGTWGGLERAFAPIENGALVPIGFARSAYYASNGRRVAIGSSDSVDVTVFDEDLNAHLRIVGTGQAREPSEREIRSWRRRLLEDVPEVPGLRQAWERGPVRGTLPGFAGLQVDALGRIWVGEYSADDAPSRRWILFSVLGDPLAQLYLPALPPARLPGPTELLTVGADRVAVLRRNDMDEEYVEVWSVGGPKKPR